MMAAVGQRAAEEAQPCALRPVLISRILMPNFPFHENLDLAFASYLSLEI